MADNDSSETPKMGIGERIVNAANNFLQGMAGSPNHAVFMGPGAKSQWHQPKDGDPAQEVAPAQPDHLPTASPQSPQPPVDWDLQM